jgi:FAD/FMN-containing dehydrogenase
MNATRELLRRGFGGEIIEPGDAEYEAASRSLFASGRPACVLRPNSVGDVQAGVRFATRAGLVLSVRGGGHGFPGFGTNDGGAVIDLGNLATVEIIDEAQHVVRIGGGATWGQVAARLAPHGLAISAGDTKSVGVGGLTLAGGIGWKVRKYGLALDQVVAADVVVADGTVLHASVRENPELFWALRGGGGNFGIVTAFEFAAHRTTDVFYGKIAFPAREAPGVLRGWADYLRCAPEELTSVVTLANPAAGGCQAPIEVHVVFDGDSDQAAATALDPIRRLGTVIADDVARTPYADTLVAGATPPVGVRLMTRSAFVARDSVSKAVEVLAATATSNGSPAIGVRSVSGAVSRVPDDATAYPHRRAELMVVTLAAGPAQAVEAAAPKLDAIWRELAPHVFGAYAGFLTSATDADVAAVYPAETYTRLASVKRRYDPGNVFARNHNVAPSSSGSDRAHDARSTKRTPRYSAAPAQGPVAHASAATRRARSPKRRASSS